MLMRHIKSVHRNIRNHVCGECGYAASEKGTLKQHIKAVHEKIKKHVCGECGYAAAKKDTLKSHMISIHKMSGNKLKCHKRVN